MTECSTKTTSSKCPDNENLLGEISKWNKQKKKKCFSPTFPADLSKRSGKKHLPTRGNCLSPETLKPKSQQSTIYNIYIKGENEIAEGTNLSFCDD